MQPLMLLAMLLAQGQAMAPAVEKPAGARIVARQCPQGRYLNCMPLSDASKKGLCSKEALAWVQAHCRDIEIVY